MRDIRVSQLTYTYPGAKDPALRDIHLEVPEASWVLLQGPTGSGKSTLLKCLSGACPAFYGGTIAGAVSLDGHAVSELTHEHRVRLVGSVHQDPEAQSVYATVGRDVAFSMENLGIPEKDMRWRVAEALDMVGMSAHHDTPTQALSGGQRQRAALASALVHQPPFLLLDEPTSQLDPVATEEWFDILQRLNQDFGITIIMSEHRLDRAYTLVDEVVYMDEGRVKQVGPPPVMAAWMRENRPEFAPNLARLFPEREVPVLTIRTARTETAYSPSEPLPADTNRPATGRSDANDLMLTVTRGDLAYEGATSFALSQCTASIPSNAITALIGSNGAGKSTLLRVMAGIQSLQGGALSGRLVEAGVMRRGKINQSRIGYLPQHPGDFISQLTVLEELSYGLRLRGWTDAQVTVAVQHVLDDFHLQSFRTTNPRDMSGGEQLRVALAAAVVHGPELLLLDEPTRGFDAIQKHRLGAWLRKRSMTAVVATHDMEFVGEFADHVLFMHQGQVVLSGSPRDVFQHALYFAPPIARALRNRDPNVVCLADAIATGWAR